jgi:hypothetical protein
MILANTTSAGMEPRIASEHYSLIFKTIYTPKKHRRLEAPLFKGQRCSSTKQFFLLFFLHLSIYLNQLGFRAHLSLLNFFFSITSWWNFRVS